jgi:SLT domain-containing protein
MSPVVIGGFAALDAAVIAQIGYAMSQYGRRGADKHDAAAGNGQAKRGRAGALLRRDRTRRQGGRDFPRTAPDISATRTPARDRARSRAPASR